MIADSITATLVEIESQPPDRWAALVETRFANDPGLARQALIWLAARPPDTDAPILDGTGRFELAGCLGRGATATVWQAYDRRLERNVALKVFRDATSSTIARSLAEARASSEVISEHVVRVYDVQGGEAPYLVLELVAEQVDGRLELGASAATVEPRDLTELVRWVRDVARGVADAHLHDIFHRDLKPHNVLITPDSRRAKIADFGLAVTSAATARCGGTPEYIAPEQAAGCPVPGRRGLVAIDVWGLGALAYTLLTKTPPWHADSAASAWELAGAGAPPPRPTRTASGAPIPARLRKIVERALAIDPAARYESARAVADELDAFLARRPTSFDRGVAIRFGLWARRNPQLTMATVVAVALALVTTAAYATVTRLRRRSAELAVEMEGFERDKETLAKRNREARDELQTIEATLGARSRELAQLRTTLDSTRLAEAALLRSKDQLLRTATTTTRELVEQISAERSDLATAELGRAMYERFWSTARDEARSATSERDTARKERDQARAERDQVLSSLAAEHTAREEAERDRDAARARVETMRHDFDARLATVASCGVISDARPSP